MPRLILLLLACLLAACGKKDNSIRIGMELTYPPFEMKDAQGNPDGVGVKMAEALAKDLGRPLKIVPMEFSGLIPALQSGNVDLVISSMTGSEKRRESIDFSEPYAFTGLAILVAKDSKIQSAEDLKKDGIRLALKTGTTAVDRAREDLPKAKIITFTEEASCVEEVTQGRADAFVYDQLSIYHYHKKNQDTTKALLNAFVQENWAVGIAKGNDELKGKVNTFIEKFRKEGGFEKLADQYLQEEKKALEELGVPFILH